MAAAAGEFRVPFPRGFPQRRPRSCSLRQDPCDRSRAFATSATSAATHLAQKSRYFCNWLTQPVNESWLVHIKKYITGMTSTLTAMNQNHHLKTLPTPSRLSFEMFWLCVFLGFFQSKPTRKHFRIFFFFKFKLAELVWQKFVQLKLVLHNLLQGPTHRCSFTAIENTEIYGMALIFVFSVGMWHYIKLVNPW